MIKITLLEVIIGLVCILSATVTVGLILTYRFRRKTREHLNKQDISTAYAGTFDPSISAKVETISLEYNGFNDENGKLVNIENFYKYIVKGDSMQFCNIFTGDLILVPKGFSITDLYNLPSVIVIKDNKALPSQCQYKIRRAWMVCSDKTDKEKLRDILVDIMNSNQFRDLQKELEKERIHQNEQELLCDFFDEKDGRLERYLRTNSDNTECQIVISTTYDTEKRKIHFSIHKVENVIGIVKYVYDINGQRGRKVA